MRERLPGSARHITAPEFTRQLVEVLAGFVAPFPERELERGSIALRLGHLARENADQLTDFCPSRVPLLFRRQAVINIFARAPIFHHAGPFYLRKMTRAPRLPHPEHLLS